MPNEVVFRKRDFKKVSAQMLSDFDKTTEETVNSIESDISSGMAVWNSETIDVRTRRIKDSLHEVRVFAKGGRFHVGFLEFGTVNQPARPVVTPTVERYRDSYLRALRRAIRKG